MIQTERMQIQNIYSSISLNDNLEDGINLSNLPTPNYQLINKSPITNNDSSFQNNMNESIKSNYKRHYFNKKEDSLLSSAAMKYHQKNWKKIAKCVPNKTPKQCRDRWMNYLKPNLHFEPWTENEDLLLVSLVKEYGTHWTLMMNHFTGRSSNSLKNRWNWLIKNNKIDSKLL